MANSDPKYLKDFALALVDGIDTEGNRDYAAIVGHFKDYVNQYEDKGKLLEALPEWENTVKKELGNKHKNFIESDFFKIFKTTDFWRARDDNIGKLADYAQAFENNVKRGGTLTLDIADKSVHKFAESIDMNQPHLDNMFTSLSKTMYSIAPRPEQKENPEEKNPAAKNKKEENPGEKKAAGAEEQEAAQPLEPWQIKLLSAKEEAMDLWKEADRTYKDINRYGTDAFTGEDTYVLKRLENTRNKAAHLYDVLIKDGRSDEADGIKSIVDTAIRPAIVFAKGKQQEIIAKHGALASVRSEIDTLKQEIDNYDKQSQLGDVDSKISRLKECVAQIQEGSTEARDHLVEAGKFANEKIAQLEGNDSGSISGHNYYKHYFGPKGEYDRIVKEKLGEYSLLAQGTASGPDGAPGFILSTASAAKAGTSALWHGWRKATLNAKTQAGRNAYNAVEHLAIFFGGVIGLNAINSIVFDDKIPVWAKAGILLFFGAYLLKRSGVRGQEAVDAERARKGAYLQSSNGFKRFENNNSKATTIRTQKQDNTLSGKDAEIKNPAETSKLAEGNSLTIKDKDGNVVKHIVVTMANGGKIKIQGHKGGIFRNEKGEILDNNNDGKKTFEDFMAAKGIVLEELPEELKKAIEDTARENLVGIIFDEIDTQKILLTDKTSGMGKAIPKGIYDLKGIDVKSSFQIETAAAKEKGANDPVTVTFYADSSIIEGKVRAALADEDKMQSTSQ